MATDPDQLAQEILGSDAWWNRTRRTPAMEHVVNAYYEREAARASATSAPPREERTLIPAAGAAATPALDAEAEAILQGNDWWHSGRRTAEMERKVNAYYERRALRQAH